ncbi:transcriptional regulator, TetR family [Frankia torreyi]|uniref:Transcriptional regulator, TetR family n=1 Tax=Frankia torreyi TaxID=1856 RepID=A0A0D8BMZ4_9ACTN|nr:MULTISPECIES: TetR/AcrR family transcriptional regulator [Frankia]KJE25379.1 transcriptional regulator, TetR family [Frankia torreyi]KQM07805.1 transcriptional regulator, TetR family [Frankia sp. CpI1-P]
MGDSTSAEIVDEGTAPDGDPRIPQVEPAGVETAAGRLGWRAARTRNAILDASKKLFLERGYAGTRINNITDACGISRAGFYTYFRDKREIFDTLGQATFQELLQVIAEWETIPRPCTQADVVAWVWKYFAFMDQHGAFILSAQSGPADESVGAASNKMQMRVAWLLGVHLRGRQRTPTDAPEALGLAVQSMMDRTWYHCHAQHLPVDDADVVTTIGGFITAVLEA